MLILVFGFVTYVSFTEDANYQIDLSEYDVRGIYKSLVHFTPILADKNGEMKDSYYNEARKQADAIKQNRASKSEFLKWEELGPNNVGGRTRAILVDKNNSDLIYAGGVAGGLWISRNGAETWEPYAFNEQLPVMSIGTITQEQDSNGLIYFSTGEPAHGQRSAWSGGFVPGEGIFKLSGPDAMFEKIESTTPDDSNSITSQWARINRVTVSPTKPGLLLAALDIYGIRRSTNGGTDWAVPDGLPEGAVDNEFDSNDVEFDATGTIVYTSINSEIYKSTDSGNSFELLNDGVTADGEDISLKGTGRTEIAISPTNNNYVYVSFTHSSGRIDRIIRTTDGGQTWERIGVYDPQFFDPFGPNMQGWFDHAIAVDPKNPDRIFFGGVTLWSWSTTDGWRKLDNFGSISVNPYYIHADKHEFEFDPANPERLFVVGDGGVFRTNQSSEENPFFIPRNKNYNVTQFYGIGASFDGRVVAGAQDNGTSYIDYIGTSTQSANLIYGGDGGYSEISDIMPNIIFASIQNGGFFRSANSGESFGTYLGPECTGAEFFEGGLFITPYHLWEEKTGDFKQKLFFYNRDFATYQKERKLYLDSLEMGEEPKYIPFEPIKPKPNGIIYSGGSKIFAAVDALNPSGVSDCFIIGAFREEPDDEDLLSAIGLSKVGTTLWAGSTKGKLIRVNGLDQNPETDTLKRGWRFKSSGTLDKFSFTDKRYTNTFSDLPFAGEYITGVNVNPNNINEVVVTTGGFGNAANIYVSTNARSIEPVFESIQGEGGNALPAMPVYEAIFDQINEDVIHAATELGVWTYRRSEQAWEEANEGIGRVRTLRIRQEDMNVQNCPVIYIATHGRGAFRSAEGARNKGCDVDLPRFVLDIEDYGIDEVKTTLNVYPNPIEDVAKVDFNLKQSANINIRVLSMTGQLMQEYNFGKYGVGNHSVEIEKGNLAAGTYLMAMEVNKMSVVSKQIVVAQ